MKTIIMILTNRFDPDVRVFKEASYLVKNGFNVEILAWDRESDYLDRPNEIIDGVKITRFYPYAKYGTGFKQLYPFLVFINKCKAYMKNKSYDYLHCHDLDGVAVGFFINRLKKKVVFDMHEFYESQKSNPILKHLVRLIVNFFQKKSDYIIYVSQEQLKSLSKKSKDKSIFLPNYPEHTYYIGCEKTESDKLRISYIGVVGQYQQLKTLMDACKDLKDVFISIHGKGIHTEALKSIEKNYKNVQITGKFHYMDSARLYSECDILYAVYSMENYQNVISEPVKFFEGILTKTPIIANEGTKIGKFIEDNNIGAAVNADSVNDVRSLIENILSNRDIIKTYTKNLAKIQFEYSWERIVKNLDEIYFRNEF
jgi:glycosyltransferase involved in cell wall biosynthesis